MENLVAPLEDPGVVAELEGIGALPHAADCAKLVALPQPWLRHWRRHTLAGICLPHCSLPHIITCLHSSHPSLSRYAVARSCQEVL